MLRKLALLIAGAGIVALLLLGQRFHRARVPDRELLIEALHVGGIDDRHINWDVFYQQAAQGYYDDAKATILLSPYDQDLQSALIALAKVRARNGDAQGAVKTARGYSPATREEAFHQIAVAQAKSGDVPGARQTASLLVTPQPALHCRRSGRKRRLARCERDHCLAFPTKPRAGGDGRASGQVRGL